MKARIWVDELIFKNGVKLKLEKDSMVVFVGPNNAGKTKALGEINAKIRNADVVDNQIIEKLTLAKQGNDEELFEMLESRKKDNNYYFSDGSGGLNANQVRSGWTSLDSEGRGQYSVTRYFVKQLDTIQRLLLVQPPNSIDIINQYPTHPIQFLKRDDDLEKLFSQNFKLAFGKDAIVNHGSNNIPIHVGERPETTITKDRVSRAYITELLKLPLLHTQGDGMKSFAGVFMGLMVEDYSINVIDEPEAFLHPPQARLLGQMIAKNLRNDKQVFIATHSEDFLKGLLDHSGNRLIVIRIQRDGTSNKINILENSDIQKIWSDPILRYSNVLSGLFHNKVVLCESDGDCRFFSALSTAICDSESRFFPDTLFVESGGKARFPVIIKALRKLDVTTIVIGDFDLYDNEEPLKTIFSDCGGDWNEIKDDFKIVKQTIDQKRPELIVADLKAEIDQIFSQITTQSMSEDQIKLIKNELKKSSPWQQAKSSGKYYLPAGDATNAFHRIQAKLTGKGVHILEVGEMEAFDKTVSGHGPKWVNGVLEKDILNDANLEVARIFVKKAILS